MAITIDWGNTYVIDVPQADLTEITPGSLYELDVDWFRGQLNALQASADGVPFPVTHEHFTEVTVGGVTLARVVRILSPYTVEFEDGQYRVDLTGANTNIADASVLVRNQVQVVPNNSAGLIVRVENGVGTPAEVADAILNALLEDYTTDDSVGFSLRLIRQMVAGNAKITGLSADGGTVTVYERDNVTPMAVFSVSNNQQDMERTS